MRPVNKGNSPYESIDEYRKALPYLVCTLGEYCSYCGFPISHVPEVEHKAAKAANGSLTDWNNLLLACKYCNTRKGKKSGSVNINEYLWPDVYNTAIAFTYKDGVPEVNEKALNTIDQTGEALRKAKNLFELLKLDVLQHGAEKDKRNRKRNEVYEIAKESLSLWKEFECAKSIKTQITNNAKACGFFSVWMEVFREEPEMLEAFIEAFPGTRKECFDENGHPKYDLMELNNPL